jgi:hypothetical protein
VKTAIASRQFGVRNHGTIDPNDPDRERNRFISLAKRAGIHLSNGGKGDPLFAWLDHLRKRGANVRRGGHVRGDTWEFESGRIERPCQASADCCYDLEIQIPDTPSA